MHFLNIFADLNGQKFRAFNRILFEHFRRSNLLGSVSFNRATSGGETQCLALSLADVVTMALTI